MQSIGIWMLGAKVSGELNIGRQGENLVSFLTLDAKQYIAAYGDGTIQVRHLRSGDTSPYPVAELERKGDQFLWTITSGDTAMVGEGLLEVRWYVGDALKISQTRKTRVEPTMQEDSTIPPDVWDGYLDRIHRSGAAVEAAAQEAIQRFDETVDQTTKDTVALVEKTGSNQVSNVKAQEKKSLLAVKTQQADSIEEVVNQQEKSILAVHQQEKASVEVVQNQQADSQNELKKTLQDAAERGVATVKTQEDASVQQVSDVGEEYLEKARQAAIKNGFALFDMDEDGNVWLTRTANIVKKVDFEITTEGDLEVIIRG